MNAEPKAQIPVQPDPFWRSTEKLTLMLLLVWAGVTFAVVFFARELSPVTLFGWPLSFYMAAQGTLLVFLGIVAVYAWRMRRIDQPGREDNHGE